MDWGVPRGGRGSLRRSDDLEDREGMSTGGEELVMTEHERPEVEGVWWGDP